MSKLLNDLIENKIPLTNCLERLLVIANLTKNNELAKWCSYELNGYPSSDDLPSYRNVTSCHIVYSGVNGSLIVANQPLPLEYLTDETIDKIKHFSIFDGLAFVDERRHLDKPIYRELSYLCSFVQNRSAKMNEYEIPLGCTSIRQLIPPDHYESIYNAVRTRVINLLCAFEQAKVNIDKIDVSSKSRYPYISKENQQIYKTIIVDGGQFSFKQENKIVWKILIPVLVAVLSSIATYFVTALLNGWLNG